MYGMNGIKNINVRKFILQMLCLILAIIGILSNSFWMISSMKKSGLFLGFVLAIIFLSHSSEDKKFPQFPYLDWILAILGLLVGFYTVFTTDRLTLEMLNAKNLDYIAAAVALLLTLEAARRVLGIWMAIIPGLFCLYALFGHRIPGVLGHFGFTLERFLLRMYLVDEGIYGLTTQVASSYIFLFILFGAFLSESGVGEFFTDIANKIAGASAGGPAKVATLSSGLMGTISGSAAANVATTGAFTIPMMKKEGFSSAFAGAVEATASTGGMIMPPVMGAAAFLMAQYLSVSYSVIMRAALLPALLYYFSVYWWVHFCALKLGIIGVKRSDIPPIPNFYRKLLLLLPLIVIIWAIFQGYTPIYAAFLGMIVTLVAGFLQRKRMTIKNIFKGLIEGAQSSISAVMACIAAGIIVGVTSMTGLGQVITYNIVGLAGDNLFCALLLTALASLVLSMGLPATACYIIVGTVVAPALIRMGAIALSAHMFVFYFSCLSNITPPVAIASYTAAGIAKANPVEVAWNSMKIAAPGFLIPFLFVYNPVMLLESGTFSFEFLWAAITDVVGVFFFTVAGAGYLTSDLSFFPRACFFVGSLLMMIPEFWTDMGGILIVTLTTCFISRKSLAGKKRENDSYRKRSMNNE
jgi:TRAP transporter 4TM/12TM fusion protein